MDGMRVVFVVGGVFGFVSAFVMLVCLVYKCCICLVFGILALFGFTYRGVFITGYL